MNEHRDGGNIKWKTSFMLPEHSEALKQIQENQEKVEKPILNQQRFNELSFKISDAMMHNLSIQVTYWFDYKLRTVIGAIIKLDTVNKKLVIGSNQVKIPFDLLVNIKLEI
ncbi:YolD-like family protein [Aneurinibacillus sp. Ricciae_BoGa-3]|uniref:YolD-like family protein n=1 Tax=Aneurinibacillus sp. Ricciae_BoGa-3 TaxID=3022697 RepID=UPI00234109B7|nr:YolD-like family protein [Aneurinibacillus sp. Ricciae_BoGa-3]WCK54741.1 YolD-like family protein [Aneurinibacillus sp. Ricciae_BoGa-3]